MNASHHTEDLSGHLILGGRIRLLQRLGAGGFGTVYRAEEYAFGAPLRTVAVKLTHERRLTDARARKLLGESRILAAVAEKCRIPAARKHLIQVFDTGLCPELEDRGYIILEFVDGTPLLEHIRDFSGSFPMATARRYFVEILTALAACHDRDVPIAHGDLKPDNILVDTCQTIRVADFGCAAEMRPATGSSAGLHGMYLYTAPETLIASGDVRSDLYSVGLIMYEVLTRKGPHLEIPEPDTVDSASHYYEAKRNLSFPPIGEHCSSLDPDPLLFTLVERCCAYHRNDRPADASAVLDALSRGKLEPPPEPGADWRETAEEKLYIRDFEGGLLFLGSIAGVSEAESGEYKAQFLEALGRFQAAIDLGGPAYEELNSAGCFPAGRRDRLLQSLIRAATALKMPSAAEYYATEMGGSAT